jgi:acetate kinase
MPRPPRGKAHARTDPRDHDAANLAGGPRISLLGAAASAWVIPTNENLMVARHARRLLDDRLRTI